MSCSKPLLRLNPHAKSLFLRHSHKLVCKKELELPQFFKFLIISRGYLHASQQFKAYQLRLEVYECPGNFSYGYECKDGIMSKDTFYFPSNNLSRLNQLLKFPRVRVQFLLGTEVPIYNEFMQLFEEHLTEAKLALYFTEMYPPRINFTVKVFLSKFSKRINEIDCMAPSLDCQPLNLDFCKICPESFDIFKLILTKHQIKELCADGWELHNKTLNKAGFPYYPKLQALTFKHYCWRTTNPLVFENFAKMIPFFPNLKKFKLEDCQLGDDLEGDQKTSRQVLDFYLNLCEKIKQFQLKFLPSTQIEIDFWSNNHVKGSSETALALVDCLKKEIFKEAAVKVTKFNFSTYSVISKYKIANLEADFTINLHHEVEE